MVVLVREDHGVRSLDAVVANVELVVGDVVEDEGSHDGEVAFARDSALRVLLYKDGTRVKSGSWFYELWESRVCRFVENWQLQTGVRLWHSNKGAAKFWSSKACMCWIADSAATLPPSSRRSRTSTTSLHQKGT